MYRPLTHGAATSLPETAASIKSAHGPMVRANGVRLWDADVIRLRGRFGLRRFLVEMDAILAPITVSHFTEPDHFPLLPIRLGGRLQHRYQTPHLRY